MSVRRGGLFAIGMMLALCESLSGQGVELGADVGVGVNSANGSIVFNVATPTSFRVGMPVGRAVSLEPRINLVFAAGEGDTFTTLDLSPAILIAVGEGMRSGTYVALLPEIALVSGFGETASRFGAGAGIGVRLQRSETFGLRIEGQFVHAFENDDFASMNRVRALIGFSFFTR